MLNRLLNVLTLMPLEDLLKKLLGVIF